MYVKVQLLNSGKNNHSGKNTIHLSMNSWILWLFLHGTVRDKF